MSLTDLACVSGSTSNTISRSVTLRGAANVMPRWRHSSMSYLGASYSYLTNSRCAVSAKSLIGNTDLNTACKPSFGRAPFGASLRRNWSYDAFCTSIRFGISPTSLTCPKTLRTRLRPVNVCAMSFLNARKPDRRSAGSPLGRWDVATPPGVLYFDAPAPQPPAPRERAKQLQPQKRRNGPWAGSPGTVPFFPGREPRGTRPLVT